MKVCLKKHEVYATQGGKLVVLVQSSVAKVASRTMRGADVFAHELAFSQPIVHIFSRVELKIIRTRHGPRPATFVVADYPKTSFKDPQSKESHGVSYKGWRNSSLYCKAFLVSKDPWWDDAL